jgi:hypothetical protein
LLPASNFLPASSTSSATNALLLGEPALALDLGPLALPVLVRKSTHCAASRLQPAGAVSAVKIAADLPVLVRDERLDLPLALDDRRTATTLHPAGGQPLATFRHSSGEIS